MKRKTVLVPENYKLMFSDKEASDGSVTFYSIESSSALVERLLPKTVKKRFQFKKSINYRSPLEAVNIENISGIILNWDTQKEDLRLLLSRHKNVEWVHSMRSGVDHLPIDEIFAKGIKLTSGKGLRTRAIAEFAMGLVYLSAKRLLRHADPAQRSVVRSELLKSAELLVFGAGAIGSAIAELARANGMRAIGVNRSGGEREHFDKVIGFEEFRADMLRSSHIVVSAPLTPLTRRYFSRSFFNSLPQPVHVINISREDLIDPHALDEALCSGKVLSASIDIRDSAHMTLYEKHRNVLLTNHSAFALVEDSEDAVERARDNLRSYLVGDELKGVVSESKRY